MQTGSLTGSQRSGNCIEPVRDTGSARTIRGSICCSLTDVEFRDVLEQIQQPNDRQRRDSVTQMWNNKLPIEQTPISQTNTVSLRAHLSIPLLFGRRSVSSTQ